MVYADVLDVLKRISGINYGKDWIHTVKTGYDFFGDIKELEPEKIFVFSGVSVLHHDYKCVKESVYKM